MSDEPKKLGTTNCTPYMTTEKNCRLSLKLSHRFSVKETGFHKKRQVFHKKRQVFTHKAFLSFSRNDVFPVMNN